MPRPPRVSLKAVQTFEAVVRCGTTIAAAAELGVTHGAVSRLVRHLEDRLAVALFERRAGRLVPTTDGLRLAKESARAFALIEKAVVRVTKDTDDRVVRVSTTGSFAALWLVPRLTKFRHQYPRYEVWISESQALVQPIRGVCDIAIRMGSGPWPDVQAVALMDDTIFPVCADKLAARLRTPADLVEVPLLHDEDRQGTWAAWLTAVGLDPDQKWVRRGPRFASSNLLLQAAADGQGVALARGRLLTRDNLRTDRLRMPFPDARVTIPTGYWLILPKRGAVSRATRTFATWLQREGSA